MDSAKYRRSTTELNSDSNNSYNSLSSSDDGSEQGYISFNDRRNAQTQSRRNNLIWSNLNDIIPSPYFNREINHVNTTNGNGALKAILFGQLLSIANACTGAASTTLANSCGINSPTAQSSFMYLLLSTFTFMLPRQNIDPVIDGNEESGGIPEENDSDMQNGSDHHRIPFTNIRLQASWYYYALLAFLDLEANYLTYLSYRDTSFTSITLLASLAIPSAMFFSRIFINRQYNVWHYCGVILCFIGFIMAVSSDIREDDQGSTNTMDDAEPAFPYAFRGDLLAITGAMMYGLNDTLTELSVKKFSIFEFLGMLGLFGTIFSIFQIIILEPDAFSVLFHHSKTSDSSTCSSFTPILLLSWNTVSLGLYYTGASYYLLKNDAALLDVSLLTTNLYAILFVIFSENYLPPHPLFYFMSVSLVVFGVCVYEKGSLSSSETVSNENDTQDRKSGLDTYTRKEIQTDN